MTYDRRLLRVVFDHPQRRVKKPRVGVVSRGIDFLSTDPTLGMWVSPITGVLQSIPNSEEDSYQSLNTGRWAKYALSDVTTLDANTPTGSFSMTAAAGMHASSAIYFTGNNTAGVGAITTATVAQNTGQNLAQFVYGQATDQSGVLIEFGWGATTDYASGESVRVYLDGRIEIYRNGTLQGKGSFGGGEYQFGSARGGSYVKASDEYVQIRAEASRGRYLLLTSSKGGVFQFACPWAVDTYNDDGTVDQAAEPILSAAKQWFRVPSGGCSVVWSKVQYAPTGTALSEVFALSEPPGTRPGGSFSARPIPADGAVTVSLVMPDGTTAFDVDQNRCRVKIVTSSAPVWIDGASTRYNPTTALTVGAGDDGQGIDVTEWLRGFTFAVEDGPEGAVATLELANAIFGLDEEGAAIARPVPVDLLDEIENRPIRIELVPHPEDDAAPSTLVLLDGVGGPPEYMDARRVVDGELVDGSYVKIEVRDRLCLLKDAELTETVTFDDSNLCKPADPSTDSAVRVCLLQCGLLDADMSLPDLDFKIEHQPPQRAGDWSFDGKAGEKWWDVLTRLFDLAPQLIWGIRPTVTVPKFTVLDPDTVTTPKATLYRNPTDAATGGEEVDAALGAYPATYDDHQRRKLPIEGNLVRVMGLDPASQKPITTFRTDDPSRDPAGTVDGRWLGNTRIVKFESPALTSQSMVEKVADSLAKAVSQRQYVEPWRSFMLFDDVGVPLWRGDLVQLDKAKPDGTASLAHISSIQPDILDESGGGLMTSGGIQAPVSIRLASYTGGALVGLGGVGSRQIRERHRKRIESGGWRGRDSHRIPSVSPFSGVIQAL